MNLINVTIWIVTATGIIFVSPAILYFYSKFDKLKKKRSMYVREPLIVRNIIYISAIHLCIERPILAAYFTGLIQNENVMKYIYLTLPCLHIIGFLSFLRVWMFYSKCTKRNNFMQSGREKTSTERSATSTIFSRRSKSQKMRKTMKSTQVLHVAGFHGQGFVTMVLIIISISYTTIQLIVNIILTESKFAFVIVNAIGILLPLIISMNLVFRIKELGDPFKFQKELHLCGTFIICMIIIIGIFNSIIKDPDTLNLFDCIVMTFSLFTLCVIQTVYVVIIEQETNPIERFSNWKNNKTNLIGCLNTQQGFSQFENHLKDEFSQLNLNFLVEVCQYKKIVMKALDLSSKDHEVDCNQFHKLNFDWFGQPEDFSGFFAKMYATHLYTKYISNSSVQQVNLPSHLSSSMEQKIIDSCTDQLPDVFDDVLEEAVLLMLDSFRRFVKTESYQQLDLTKPKQSNIQNIFGVIPKKPQKVHFLNSASNKESINSLSF